MEAEVRKMWTVWHNKTRCNHLLTMEFLDAITEGDIAEEDDTNDEDATEHAGPSPTVPPTLYGYIWFFYCSRSNFFLLFLYSMHFYLECQL